MDEHALGFMKAALNEALNALELGEVPVGAVVVKDDTIIAKGYNQRETRRDIFGHAELYALKAASEALGSWRLGDCTLYVTLEPCAMCAAACAEAQLKRIVFGAFDEDYGACGSAMDLVSGRMGRAVETIGGVCEALCRKLLSDFFTARRRAPGN